MTRPAHNTNPTLDTASRPRCPHCNPPKGYLLDKTGKCWACGKTPEEWGNEMAKQGSTSTLDSVHACYGTIGAHAKGCPVENCQMVEACTREAATMEPIEPTDELVGDGSGEALPETQRTCFDNDWDPERCAGEGCSTWPECSAKAGLPKCFGSYDQGRATCPDCPSGDPCAQSTPDCFGDPELQPDAGLCGTCIGLMLCRGEIPTYGSPATKPAPDYRVIDNNTGELVQLSLLGAQWEQYKVATTRLSLSGGDEFIKDLFDQLVDGELSPGAIVEVVCRGVVKEHAPVYKKAAHEGKTVINLEVVRRITVIGHMTGKVEAAQNVDGGAKVLEEDTTDERCLTCKYLATRAFGIEGECEGCVDHGRFLGVWVDEEVTLQEADDLRDAEEA